MICSHGRRHSISSYAPTKSLLHVNAFIRPNLFFHMTKPYLIKIRRTKFKLKKCEKHKVLIAKSLGREISIEYLRV